MATYTLLYITHKGSIGQHMELNSMLCGSLDTRICMVESLHCSPETVTLLICYEVK